MFWSVIVDIFSFVLTCYEICFLFWRIFDWTNNINNITFRYIWNIWKKWTTKTILDSKYISSLMDLTPLAKINITSELHSIGTIRIRGWSKHTNYLDNYMRVLRKKFCSKFCLFVYLLTKMCAISRNFGPRKFLKIFFSFFHYYFGF